MSCSVVCKGIDNLSVLRNSVLWELEHGMNEVIADRIVFLLNGDIKSINELLSGVPSSIEDSPQNLLTLESVIKADDSDIIRINKIEFQKPDISIYCSKRCVVYIKPGDDDSRKKIEDGHYYSADKSYSPTDIYTEPVVYETDITLYENIYKLISSGVKFNIV